VRPLARERKRERRAVSRLRKRDRRWERSAMMLRLGERARKRERKEKETRGAPAARVECDERCSTAVRLREMEALRVCRNYAWLSSKMER